MIPERMPFATKGRPASVIAVLAALFGLIVGGCGAGGERGGRDAPDVVVIVVDTLRADHLSQYGYQRPTSPALERFTAESTLFAAAYSTSSWTQPSVASLFTGLLPARHGVVKQSAILPSEFETLAGLLSGGGWNTAGFSGNLFVGEKTGFDRGFEYFEGHDGKVLVYPDVEDMLERVDLWLNRAHNEERPSFLYFQPMNCHGPYRVPVERRADLLGEAPSEAFDYNDDLMEAILKKGDLAARERVTPEYLESLRDQYDTAIRYSMDTVGLLLETLRNEGLYDNALIVVTSDHGEELFDHGGFGHGYSLFEEVVRIPLWIKRPRQRESARVEQPVSLVDLLPTILETTGIDLTGAPQLDGSSLLPLLEDAGGSGAFRSRPILTDTRWKRRAVASSIRLGKYKLLEIESDYEGRSNQKMLFDLNADPGETVDLSSAHPDKVTALSEAAARVLESKKSTVEVESAGDLDVEGLRALGYLD